VPDSTPAIDRLMIDASDRIWVRRWSRRWEPPPPRIDTWDVIDTSGRWLGWVEIDNRIGSVLSIGNDHILVRTTDSLDVVSVRQFSLHRVRGSR